MAGKKGKDQLVPQDQASLPPPPREEVFVCSGHENIALQHLIQTQPLLRSAAKHLSVPSGQEVLLWSADNALGLLLADGSPAARIEIQPADWGQLELCRRSLARSPSIRNLTLRDPGVPPSESRYDKVIYLIPPFVPMRAIEAQISAACALAKPAGCFVLIGHTQQGVKRLIGKTSEIIGSDPAVVHTGRGGYRIAEYKRTDAEVKAIAAPAPELIRFTVLDREFVAESPAGLFSAKDLDAGTRLLLETAPPLAFSRLLDLGCGWGAIGLVAARICPQGAVLMVDVDPLALAAARSNVERLNLADRVTVKPSTDLPGETRLFDLVLSNPPFHASAAELEELFALTAQKLQPEARVALVVERTYLAKLRIALAHTIGKPEILAEQGKFIVLTARR